MKFLEIFSKKSRCEKFGEKKVKKFNRDLRREKFHKIFTDIFTCINFGELAKNFTGVIAERARVQKKNRSEISKQKNVIG